MFNLRSFALLGIFSVSGAAMAGTLDVSSMSAGKFQVVNIAVYGGSLSVYAGPQASSYNGGAQFDGYCVDLAHDQYLPASFAATTRGASTFLPNGERIAKLVNQFSSTVNDADKGAALQLAIWDILVDGGDGVNVGNFQASGLTTGTQSYFSSYLTANIAGASSIATVYEADFHGAGNNVNQNLIGAGGNGGTEAVPEPASMAALAMGGLAFLRRRKKA